VISFLRTDAANYNNAHLAYGFNGDPNNPIGSRYYGFLTRTRPPVP
jgi:hypothetical protein